MDKPVLVYVNPDCYTQVDDTVLHHLTKDFKVIWFYEYYSLLSDSMRYDPGKASEYANKHGIVLEIIDSKLRLRDVRNIAYYREVAKRIEKYKPDIVYSCDYYFWTICLSLIKKGRKVYGIHDAVQHSAKLSVFPFIAGLLARRCINSIEHFITFSPNQHDLFYRKYGKESFMVGMSYKSFGESQLQAPAISDGIKLLFFGTIIKYKGLDLLINAIEGLKREGINNLSLTIAGKGEAWEECRSLIRTPSIYDLKIRFIDNMEIPDLMCSHHFIVLPYRDATQSGPLVTALYYGLPVIAPNYGCFNEVLDEASAFLYTKGSLSQALKRVSSLTQEHYVKIKNNMWSLRDKYSEEHIGIQYINAFKRVLDGEI